MGLEGGIALNPATPTSVVEPLIGLADLVLVMTVNPGWGGQAFIETCLDKVKAIRKLDPAVNIEVDGGIDPLTLPLARAAGANVFVVGSWLAKQACLKDGLQELRSLCA
jgi:ribulose-phosphate 3-epimerase